MICGAHARDHNNIHIPKHDRSRNAMTEFHSCLGLCETSMDMICYDGRKDRSMNVMEDGRKGLNVIIKIRKLK
jgi:hypothetical protein